MQAKRYLVRGRVQGVGFRYFVWREAEALGVAGWVRNMADGSVEVVAAGSGETLDLLMRRLQEGPRSSRVKSVAVAQVPTDQVPGGFEIRRDAV
ncbi:MAG: acylphosphatase [Acidobacteria bacterium]|jgi:acylphosphatase|nr:acylphosphatase [Acidobacteriota bacterium]